MISTQTKEKRVRVCAESGRWYGADEVKVLFLSSFFKRKARHCGLSREHVTSVYQWREGATGRWNSILRASLTMTFA